MIPPWDGTFLVGQKPHFYPVFFLFSRYPTRPNKFSVSNQNSEVGNNDMIL